jgi:hypothetical protein
VWFQLNWSGIQTNESHREPLHVVVVTSPLHSSTAEKANKRRKLTRTPVFVIYLALALLVYSLRACQRR